MKKVAMLETAGRRIAGACVWVRPPDVEGPPYDLVGRLARARACAGSAGQAVIDVDPLGRDAEAGRDLPEEGLTPWR
jgi:hypothetical protein